MRSNRIEAHKAALKLTPVQREIVVGVLLGDACLESRDQGRTFRLKVEQSAVHEEYVRHLRAAFGPWVLSEPVCRQKSRAGRPTTSWAFNSVNHPAFRFYAKQFYPLGRKRVPKLIHRWLTPRGLAYWFMDDGSLKTSQSKAVLFNTHGFQPSDVERLVDLLVTRFQLAATVRRQKDGLQIFVSGKSFEQFRELVDPYIIDSMRYKLPLPRRTRMPKE